MIAVLANKYIIFWYLISFMYYINLCSSIICFLFSGGISLSNSIFPALLLAVFDKVFETFVTWSAILLPVKSPVVSAVFWISLFEVVLSAFAPNFLALLRIFWLYLPLRLLLKCWHYFYPYFQYRMRISNLSEIFFF